MPADTLSSWECLGPEWVEGSTDLQGGVAFITQGTGTYSDGTPAPEGERCWVFVLSADGTTMNRTQVVAGWLAGWRPALSVQAGNSLAPPLPRPLTCLQHLPRH